MQCYVTCAVCSLFVLCIINLNYLSSNYSNTLAVTVANVSKSEERSPMGWISEWLTCQSVRDNMISCLLSQSLSQLPNSKLSLGGDHSIRPTLNWPLARSFAGSLLCWIALHPTWMIQARDRHASHADKLLLSVCILDQILALTDYIITDRHTK